jgi:hypothetical protein
MPIPLFWENHSCGFASLQLAGSALDADNIARALFALVAVFQAGVSS